MLTASIAVAVAAGAAVLLWPRESEVRVVELGGVEYTTNVELSETGGSVYARIPVNSDVEEIVLSVPDPADTERIRSYVDGLDTFLPGEHVIELSDSRLHLIVDGIEGED